MTTLQLDSKTKTVQMTLQLDGETEPLHITAQYLIENDGGHLFIVPQSVETSKPWMTNLVKDFIGTKYARLPVPSGLPTTAIKFLGL